MDIFCCFGSFAVELVIVNMKRKLRLHKDMIYSLLHVYFLII